MARKTNHETDRRAIERFDQIINIGPAMTGDFVRMGIESPQALIGRDPLVLYQQICELDQLFHDPCVLDVYMATTDYMNGNPPQVWWNYTSERKKRFAQAVDSLRERFGR